MKSRPIGIAVSVHGVRCALSHALGSETEDHRQYSDARKFGRHDEDRYANDSAQDERLAIIGASSFLNDVVCALGAFWAACKADQYLRVRAERRFPKILATLRVEGRPRSG